TVVLTGTFANGEASVTKDFAIRVRFAIDPSRVTTIAAGVALPLKTFVTWEAMTILGVGTDGFFFTDGTDVMFVYSAAVAATVTAGEVYDIIGGISLYNSIPEVQNIETNVVSVVASSAAAREVTPTAATIEQIIANHTGYNAENPMEFGVYTVTGRVYYNADGGNYSTYIIPTDSSTLDKNDAIRIYYKSNMTAVSDLAGQVVTLDIVLFGFNSSATALDWYGYFFGTADDITAETMTDAEKLALDVSKVDLSYDVTNSFTLPTLAYATYSNVTISSEITSYLSYADSIFTVVRPEADTTGTLSVTLTFNAEVATLSIGITMKAAVVVVPGNDIFISQYIEGSSYNKFIEIYNPLDVTVDLSEYTLELYSNGSTATTATLTLSGTLAPGAVVVIYNDKSDPLIYTGDIINITVINYNGDDAIVLKHNDIVVDSIGQVGVDPGDFWGTVELGTKDCTLIRNASVTGGDTNPFDEFDPSNEWTGYAKDSVVGMGSHTVE
ncbi:MAG: lamin tail domain-containing protein, partial [Candidatus Izemoplasmatales bacterium]|nr:lamin tail domain-containing protein [Candidatus Izemoplasmatales bacterium]